ncbi:HAMP domain-containing sensor histidine kinase [Kribbella sp. NPDC050820]|uniref:sensor histidine kinase n=1 Tax=Kribbella sp. NPDC050820 TaxID=3155408 RepID=UPI0034093D93
MRNRLSTAARVTVVAGLIGTLLAAGFAFWLRHEVYESRYRVTERVAEEARFRIFNNAWTNRTLTDQANGFMLHPTYEIVDSSGRIIESTGELRAYQQTGSVAPVPPRRDTFEMDSLEVTFGEYDPSRDGCVGLRLEDHKRCEYAKRLAGRRIKVFRRYDPTAFLLQHARRVEGDAPTTSIAVFVLPFEAEDAVGEVDRVLRWALPAGVLLIMVGAYVATRAALRPVERMRGRAAAISERNLHERVPVPGTRDVVARLASTLNDTLGRLESAADRQRGFVADAAHELRSPIASLRATLEVAAEHPDRADWQQVVRTAADETRRLQELADDLLLVARLDAQADVPKTTVDLAELVRRHLARRLDDEGPALVLESIEEAPVLGNEQHLDRLVRNLVDNATQHAAGQVVVRILGAPTEAVLQVDDDGPGIPEADREWVFERFTRLDESRSRDAGGVGLGLAIAREIAVRHGGTLTLGESPAGGVRATLVLRRPA